MVGVQPPLVGEPRARIPDERIVGGGVGAVDVTVGHGVAAVELERERVAVVEEARRRGAPVDLVQAPQRIVSEVGGLPA